MRNNLLTRRVVEIIEKKHLEKKLQSGEKLRVKLGIDPNKRALHLGHAVTLWKLREFQDAGHTAVFIIGDWTAQIGDPSEKAETRERLSKADIRKNVDYFFSRTEKILDKNKLEIHLQSEWFGKFGLAELIELTAKTTVSQLMAHETFRKRLKEGKQFLGYEMLYPLLQGYDSVAVRADVELGALEQKFNLLMGRRVQKGFGQEPQDAVLVDYLIGLDGKEKMSKSLNNYVAITDPPAEMFGKVMSIPDGLIKHYFELCTNVAEKEIKNISKERPREQKIRLAKEIVELYHGGKKAADAEKEFNKKFGKEKGEVKADFELKKKPGSYLLSDILAEGKLASSKSEARRKVGEGAVEHNGNKIIDERAEIKIKTGDLLRLGKRFLRIK